MWRLNKVVVFALLTFVLLPSVLLAGGGTAYNVCLLDLPKPKLRAKPMA